MKVRVQIVIGTGADEPEDAQSIIELTRTELRPDTLGLTLEEAKTVLAGIQRTIVEQQTAEYLRTQSHCPHCGKRHHHKGQHTVTLRTVFGKVRLKSPRLYHCQC